MLFKPKQMEKEKKKVAEGESTQNPPYSILL